MQPRPKNGASKETKMAGKQKTVEKSVYFCVQNDAYFKFAAIVRKNTAALPYLLIMMSK